MSVPLFRDAPSINLAAEVLLDMCLRPALGIAPPLVRETVRAAPHVVRMYPRAAEAFTTRRLPPPAEASTSRHQHLPAAEAFTLTKGGRELGAGAPRPDFRTWDTTKRVFSSSAKNIRIQNVVWADK